MSLELGSERACRQPIASVLAHLEVDPKHGLSDAEAERRRQVCGRNVLQAADKESSWKQYLAQFKEPLNLLLLGSAAISLLMGQYDDAFSITLAIVIVVTVAFVQEYKSEQALEKLTKMVPQHCHCLRDGQNKLLSADDLVPGDVVLLSTGDRVPADMRLVQATDMLIEESSLTGEAEPCAKSSATLAAATEYELGMRTNMAFMGTMVRGGRAVGVVTATGAHTEFGLVFGMVESVEQGKTPLQENMEELGTKLSFMSFGIIAFIVVVGLLQGRNIVNLFTIAVSLAVAAIPEGLPIVVTVTLALGVHRMASKHAIVKRLPAVEALGSASVVCSDKTGTLTANKMVAKVVYDAAHDIHAQVTGSGYQFSGRVMLGDRPVSINTPAATTVAAAAAATANTSTLPMITITPTATAPASAPSPSSSAAAAAVKTASSAVEGAAVAPFASVIEAAVLCNNAEVHTDGTLIGQPTEGALVALSHKFGAGDARQKYTRSREIPFSSETKWMAVFAHPNDRPPSATRCYLKGSVEHVLSKCTVVPAPSVGAPPLAMTQQRRGAFIQRAEAYAGQGFRVIAIAEGPDLDRLAFLGLVAIADQPREGVKEAVATLQRSGVIVMMITGDMRATAESIAHQLGFFDPNQHTSLSGKQLEVMSDVELQQRLHTARVFYQTTPRHKMRIVDALQSEGHVVAMTGDGVNDAPALKLASIGVAMGETGTDVAREAADMILVDDNFSTIMAAICEGKGIAFNVRNFLRFQLSTSVAALSLISLSTLFGLENPLNAMQILWINIIMDGPPAQSLGVEPVDPDVMKVPPRRKKDPIITKQLIRNVLTSAVIIVCGTLYVFWREHEADGLITRRDTTMTFTTFVFFDMFNALSCRSATKSVLEIGLFANRAFLFAVGGSIIGQLAVIFFPPLQSIFQTEALSLWDLVYIICLTSTVLIVDEARKRWALPNKRRLRVALPF